MAQLSFDLPRREATGRADLMVTGANAEALALLDGDAWPEGRLALVGPEGSGKSHMAAIWAEEAGARVLRAVEGDPVALAGAPLVVEDVDRWLAGGGDGTALFHLLNACLAAGTPLLLTGRSAPSEWPTDLPDLASRLAATTPATLRAPDDVMLSMLLVKLFADRQLRVGPALVGWLLPRMERSHAAALRVVETLDAAALARGQEVGVPLAREVLGGQGDLWGDLDSGGAPA